MALDFASLNTIPLTQIGFPYHDLTTVFDAYHPMSHYPAYVLSPCFYCLHLLCVCRELPEPASIDRVLILDRPVRQIPVSYTSCSIGSKPGNTLRKKLDAISIAGFAAIELSFPNILSFGKLHLEHEVSPTNYDELCIVAAEIRRL